VMGSVEDRLLIATDVERTRRAMEN
jgi:hypothetical protein